MGSKESIMTPQGGLGGIRTTSVRTHSDYGEHSTGSTFLVPDYLTAKTDRFLIGSKEAADDSTGGSGQDPDRSGENPANRQ